MRRADIEVPNGAVDVNSWAPSACYPRGSFYPLSDTPSTRRYQITKPDFRLCSTCWSRSQAPLCLCTLRLISIQPEGTFGRLRYSLGTFVRLASGSLYRISGITYGSTTAEKVSNDRPDTYNCTPSGCRRGVTWRPNRSRRVRANRSTSRCSK